MSPAVESIIARCLAPDPAARYQGSLELLEDLDRHLARRPLRHAPNTSWWELVKKWVSRHQTVLIGAVAATGLTLTLAGFAYHEKQRAAQVAQLELDRSLASFTRDLRETDFSLGLAESHPAERTRAQELAQNTLGHLGAWSDERWFEHPRYQELPEHLQQVTRRQVAGLQQALASLHAQAATRATEATSRAALLHQASDWNRRAEASGPDLRSVWSQRAFLAQLAGEDTEARSFRERADSLARTPADSVSEARQLLTEGKPREALPLLLNAVQLEPGNYWACFTLALCHQRLDQLTEAANTYDLCVSLQPGFFGTHYNRALVRLRLRQVGDAEADFNTAITLRPGWAEAHFQRALCHEILKHYPEALEDLDRARELGFPATVVLLSRSRVHRVMKDIPAAERDLGEALRVEPKDERGWLARAQAQLWSNPENALKDYDRALELNPRLVSAWQGKAHLLSRSGETSEALNALSKLLEVTPDSPDAWSGRAVLHARLGNREAALKDARQALRLSQQASTLYQVAGVYARTQQGHPEDHREALSLLDGALRAGFGFDLLERDPELEKLRQDPEFLRLVDAARTYREQLK